MRAVFTRLFLTQYCPASITSHLHCFEYWRSCREVIGGCAHRRQPCEGQEHLMIRSILCGSQRMAAYFMSMCYMCRVCIHACRFIYTHTCAPLLLCFSGEDRLIHLSLNINLFLPIFKKSRVCPGVAFCLGHLLQRRCATSRLR